MAKCLCCYKELKTDEVNYHAACVRRFFGKSGVPALPYTHHDIQDLAKQVVRAQVTITGVQPKLSMDIEHIDNQSRFTIVGLWGRYILKPQTKLYPYLPEVEDLTMHLAEDAQLEVVPHTLVEFGDGELGYLTKRIDRTSDIGNGRYVPTDWKAYRIQISWFIRANRQSHSTIFGSTGIGYCQLLVDSGIFLDYRQ